MLKTVLGFILLSIPLLFLLILIIGSIGWVGVAIIGISILMTVMIATGIALLCGEL
jgi:hypothetical protein